MVHNGLLPLVVHFAEQVVVGIEYGDMQLICEAYHLLKQVAGLSNQEMHEVFAEWNKGELDSYLIEITRDILVFKEENEEGYVYGLTEWWWCSAHHTFKPGWCQSRPIDGSALTTAGISWIKSWIRLAKRAPGNGQP